MFLSPFCRSCILFILIHHRLDGFILLLESFSSFTRYDFICSPNYAILDYPFPDADESLSMLALKPDASYVCIETWGHDRTFSGCLAMRVGPPYRQIEGVVYTILGEKNFMLLIKDNNERVYVVGVHTRWLLREVPDLSSTRGLSRQNVVPMEMNWPTFFVSRLGQARL